MTKQQAKLRELPHIPTNGLDTAVWEAKHHMVPAALTEGILLHPVQWVDVHDIARAIKQVKPPAEAPFGDAQCMWLIKATVTYPHEPSGDHEFKHILLTVIGHNWFSARAAGWRHAGRQLSPEETGDFSLVTRIEVLGWYDVPLRGDLS